MSSTSKCVKGLFILFIFLSTALQAQDSEMMTLNDCIQVALENNSNLRTVELADEAAKIDVLGSYEGILPSINASAGQGKLETGPSEYLSNEPVGIDPETGNVIYEQRTRKTDKFIRESSSASLSISQTLFDGGIWWNQIRKSSTDRKSSKFNLANQRNNTILEVQQAYFDLNKQIRLIEVYELAVQRSDAQLKRAEQMFELGATARLDVFRARVNLGNDRIALINQQNVVKQARHKLNIVMGRDPVTPITIETEMAAKQDLPKVDELIEIAMENQPMLRKNEYDIKSSHLSATMARGLMFPRITAYFNYDRFHEDIRNVYSNFDQNYQARYGVNLSFNIFNGFSDYVNIQKADINKRTAMENFENYKRNLKSTIVQYYNNYKSYFDIIEINRMNLEAAREELRLAEERFQIGAGTSLEVREAQVNLTRAEQTLIDAQYNARIILAQLDSQIGLSFKKFNEDQSF